MYASFTKAAFSPHQAYAALDVTKMPVFGRKSAAPPPKPAPAAAARRKSDAGADLLWQAQLNADAKRQDALAKKPAEPHRGPTSGGAAAARARPKSLAETMASLDQLEKASSLDQPPSPLAAAAPAAPLSPAAAAKPPPRAAATAAAPRPRRRGCLLYTSPSPRDS